MSHTFTSLRYPLEKLQEAEYFLARQTQTNGIEFQFELNAFLSASRGVTFFLQKAMAHVEGFEEWYRQQQVAMKADAAMRFFLALRNVSQKQGPVSYIGGSMLDGGWSYRFVGQLEPVPGELTGRDICECCADHLTKVARLILECHREFPFDSCPGRAFTEEGMKALGYSMADVESALGLPPGYIDVVDFSIAEKLRVLSREIEPLDIEDLERLASGDFRSQGTPLRIHKCTGRNLVNDIAALIESGANDQRQPREIFLKAIAKRINDIETL